MKTGIVLARLQLGVLRRRLPGLHRRLEGQVPVVAVVLVGPVVQLRDLVIELRQPLLIGLVACRAGVAAAIAPGQRRRLPQGVHHGLPPVLHVLVPVILVQHVGVEIIIKVVVAESEPRNAEGLARHIVVGLLQARQIW